MTRKSNLAIYDKDTSTDFSAQMNADPHCDQLGFVTKDGTYYSEEDIVEAAMRMLERRMLDKLAKKLVGHGERPEDLDDFQLFLRAGFLGIDLETREKLKAHLQQKRLER